MWYRRPENYHGMNVAVLGARFSGVDIAFELSKQANKVSTIYGSSDLYKSNYHTTTTITRT
jgi:cation diffusion facilitator CzcD-associated flavoprotein CzcO